MKIDTDRNRTGFTLIELLVVIAIIAIIAAILFPVFSSAREKARITSCLSNEKQIGLGVMQYVQDFDESYPCGHLFFTQSGRGWAGQVYPYVKSTDAFTCPDDTFHKSRLPTVSYALNMQFASVARARQVSEIVTTARTVYLFEIFDNETFTATPAAPDFSYENFSGAAFGGANGGASLDNSNQVFATGEMHGDTTTLPRLIMTSADGRHQGGSNFLFADGHAKWLLPNLVSPGYANDGQGYKNPLGAWCGGTASDTTVYSATAQCNDKSLGGTFSLQ